MPKEVFITETNIISPLGFDVAANIQHIEQRISGVCQHQDFRFSPVPFFGGLIDPAARDTAFSALSAATEYTPLEKMLILALHPIVKTTPGPKTALILSTTKGNISVLAGQQDTVPPQAYLQHLAHTVGAFFKFQTTPIVISNACVSGILAVATAQRLIATGMYHDAYVISGDEFSEFVFSGFSSFQALSDAPCKPYSAHRTGLNLGEAAAAVYVTADPELMQGGVVKIIGTGAINDANHISGPSRTGEGLYRSIESALQEAKIPATALDYISAHGTATLYNDEMEAIAFNRLGLGSTPVNSFKGYYGHTLGASGLLETILAMASAKHNRLFESLGYDESGVSVPLNVITEHREQNINYFLKTASGFGGCNTAVIFEKI